MSDATLHHELKKRWISLEIAILSGDDAPETWNKHHIERLRIEQDEPPIFRALDLLCHNEVAMAEGFVPDGENCKHFATINFLQRFTRHFLHWADLR